MSKEIRGKLEWGDDSQGQVKFVEDPCGPLVFYKEYSEVKVTKVKPRGFRKFHWWVFENKGHLSGTVTALAIIFSVFSLICVGITIRFADNQFAPILYTIAILIVLQFVFLWCSFLIWETNKPKTPKGGCPNE